MPFITLTNADDQPIRLNTDHVLYAEPNGQRAKIHFTNGNHLRVQQSYEDVAALLPTYTLLESAEGAVPEITVEPVEKTPEQLAEEQAALEHDAQEARKGKGNPAKDRETK